MNTAQQKSVRSAELAGQLEEEKRLNAAILESLGKVKV